MVHKSTLLQNGGGGGGGGTISNITSTGGTITVTNPTGPIVNLEAAGGSSVSFQALTSGTNIAATMVVGTGASLAPSGSGAITATIAPAGTLTGTTLASNVVTSSLTTIGTIISGIWNGTKIGLGFGGTNADLSATGGTHQVLKQSSSGAAITVGQLANTDISGLGTAAVENLGSVIIDDGAGNLTIGSAQVTNTMLAGSIAAGKLTLTSADIIVGNGSNVGAQVAMSGDVHIDNTGSTTIQANAVTTSKINNSAVTYAKIQNESASTLLGNPTGSPAAPSEITLGSGLSFSGTTLVATGTGGTVTSVSGTANRITSTGGTTPVIDISASYVGQSSITTLGTIATGTWQGTKIGLAYGGTNADLSATGGTSNVLKQSSSGAAITVGQLAASDLSNGTTGSGAVVLASAPTMTNPVVGTQSAGDNSTKGASTAYVTSAIATAISGINPAVAVQAATTANVAGYTYNNGVSGVGATLTQNSAAIVVIDGYTLLLNDRVLFKNQTAAPSGSTNGVYFVSTLGTGIIPAVFTRALDYDQPSDINNTGAIPVINGTVNGSTSWVLTSQVTTIGTDPLTYVQFTINPTTILTNTLTNTHIFVGNSSNVATDVAASGDLTLANTGAFTVAKIQGTTVSGTTGTTNVVFSSAPTLSNPVVGTQSAADNSTKAASTAYADRAASNASGVVSALSLSIPGTGPANQTIYADAKAAFGYTINSILGAATSSGTIVLAVKINGTNVTSLSAVTISSSSADTSATGANTVNAGDQVTWVFSSNSSAADLRFTMKITRT